MNRRFWLRFGPVWAPEDGGAAGGDAAAAAAAAAAQAGAGEPPPAKWFEGDLLTADERTWLGAKGLNLDDPLQAIPKLVRGHRSAEQYMGKGVDRIIERPADGQAYAEWARANAAALGLPEAAEGYQITPPESWPKDAQWDTGFETAFRKVAFEEGLPPAAANKLVGLYAEKVKGLADAAEQGYAEANTKMMGELSREYGDQVPVVIARAKQGAQAIAEKAGLDAEALTAVTSRLSRDMGDAQTIRFMAAIGELMGEDSAIGLGKGAGTGLTSTRSQAEQALADFMKPDGEWAKASMNRDPGAIARLRPKFEQLTRAVAALSGK
ncbi:hypothetical protein D2T29_00520 [Sinirhodobacter populi]|uniref:Uncharacterized protein n=1 Tax=Paenirhodobacter populi TaxID=2306993 RepID=A0A443KPU5_9RHOB|nr:hypothetical protein [Sinirhodobacter populi]RWR34995.1 hypothetical protein D2T29_00520 [Sinirhodobacter populi]